MLEASAVPASEEHISRHRRAYRGTCLALRWLMKSASGVIFRRSCNSRYRFLSRRPDDRRTVTAVRSVELDPVLSCLIREAESSQWRISASAECVDNGSDAGWCTSSSAVKGRPVQWRWVSWTATLLPRSPGCDNIWASGSAGLVAGRRSGIGQGPLQESDDPIILTRCLT